MKNYIMLACVLAFIGCSSTAPQRATAPAFKGMELYSWKPVGQDWHFSLLPGTNGLKPIEIIEGTAVVGIRQLKPKLAQLAKGESVFWQNLTQQPVPQRVVDELTSFCAENQVCLTIIETHNKALERTSQ